jgi:hypothetical protein
MLLVEYLEVMVPLVNALYLVGASQCESAIDNPKVMPFYRNPPALQSAVANILSYLVLQALTLVAMCVALQRKFGLSALPLLAFALESQAWSLQGMQIAWLPVIFACPIVHSHVASGQLQY